jgi:diacylglycerol kinase (ATP)
MQSRTTHQRRALIVASPRVYNEGGALEEAQRLLQQHGIISAATWPVDALDGQPPLAEEWKREGIDLVIAAGGDGSIGAVATHLSNSGLPLGILPLGTSNDFARSLRLPLTLEEACHTIAQGHLLPVDLGCAQPALSEPYALHEADGAQPASPSDGAGQPRRAFFTHALTLGLNVTFAQLATSATMRRRFGPFTYPLAALNTLGNARSIDFTLTFQQPACALTPGECEDEIEPGQPYHYQALQVAVINSPLFGGAFEFALAGVELHDHLLDILIIENFDVRQLLAAAQTALTPAQNGWREADSRHFPGIRHVRARQVIIETAGQEDVTLDGELRGRTPMLVSSVARALQVMVPEVPTESAAPRVPAPAAQRE